MVRLIKFFLDDTVHRLISITESEGILCEAKKCLCRIPI